MAGRRLGVDSHRGSGRTPAVAPGIALIMGTLAGAHVPDTRLTQWSLLLALGLALGYKGRLISVFAVGCVLACLQQPRPMARTPEAMHPVEVSGRLDEPWTRSELGWRSRLQVDSFRQAARVRIWRQEVWIYSPFRRRPSCRGLVRVRGFIGRPAGYANLPPTPPGSWRIWLKSPHFLRCVDTGRSKRSSLRERLRQRVGVAISVASRPSRDFVRLFALGDPGALPTSLIQSLRRLGLSHLLAISGLHVGVVALFGLCLPLPGRARELAALIAVLAYVWWVGARPSLIRAAIMGVLAGGALVLKRRPAGVNALACAAAGMVLVRSDIVGDTGFQLSVAATAGILLFALPLAARWSRLPRLLAIPLAVTVSAQLSALPWMVYHFHTVAPLAPIANLLVVPWMGMVLLGSLLFAFVSGVAPHLANPLVPVLSGLVAPLLWLTRIPPSISPIVPVSWTFPTAVVVASSILFVLWLSRPRGFAVAGVCLVCFWLLSSRAGTELSILDVGQGEAVLLRDHSKAILIDGGGWRHGDFGGSVLLPVLGSAGIRRIDRMIMTHSDQDHCGGLLDLAHYLPIGRVLAAPQQRSSPCWDELSRLPGVHPEFLHAGDGFGIGRWHIEVLGPAKAGLTGNDRSLVLRVVAGGTSILLPGDVEKAGERALVARWGSGGLRSRILLVPHHGSRSSSSEELLHAVQPSLAIISVGRHNPYGHPAPSVLARLRRHEIRVLRTDRDGLVRIVPMPMPLRIRLPASPR